MRILVVDDLSLMRRTLATSLRAVPGFEVIGQAESGAQAIQMTQRERPDVVLLDLFMPGTDVDETLNKLLKIAGTKVLVMAPADDAGSEAARRAMASGASDFLVKRRRQEGLTLHDALTQKLKAMDTPPVKSSVVRPAGKMRLDPGSLKLICIGASTGGPPVLETILGALPGRFDLPVVLAQHMPASFTGSLAGRLDGICAAPVEHMQEGLQELEPGKVYVARGGRHLQLCDKGNKLFGRTVDQPESDLYRPSVSVLLESAATTHFGPQTLGIVLTGIGDDGLRGARAIKKRGGTIIAQDEASCVVYGMPRVVASEGFADGILTPEEIGATLRELAACPRRAA